MFSSSLLFWCLPLKTLTYVATCTRFLSTNLSIAFAPRIVEARFALARGVGARRALGVVHTLTEP